MTIKVSKQLATMQDLAIGVGQVVQRRNGIDLTLDKIDLATNTEVQDRVIRVTSIAAMEAYSVPAGYVFSLNAGGRSGTFDVVSGDFSTELAADTENGIYIGLTDNPTATTKVAKRRYNDVVLVEWFGVTPSATDNTSAYNALIAAVPLGSKVVWGEVGTYSGHFNSTEKSLRCDLNGSTLVNVVDNSPIISIGSLTNVTEYDVTESTLAYLSRQFTVSGADTLFAAGDIGYFWDQAARPAGGSVNFEVVKIKSISGDTVTLDGFIAGHQGASGIKFYHDDNQIKNPEIKNGFIFPTVTHTFIVSGFFNCERTQASNLVISGFTGNALANRYCYDVTVENIRPENPVETGSGQGYGVSMFGVTLVSAHNIKGIRCRHVYDQDSAYFVEISDISDFDAMSAPVVLAHNGFAGHIKCHGVDVVTDSYPTTFASQGYGGSPNATAVTHPFREIVIDDVKVKVKPTKTVNDFGVWTVYFQNSVENINVSNISVYFYNGESPTTSSSGTMFRINGKILGLCTVSKISTNKSSKFFFLSSGDSTQVGGNLTIRDIYAAEIRNLVLAQGEWNLDIDRILLENAPLEPLIILGALGASVPSKLQVGSNITYRDPYQIVDSPDNSSLFGRLSARTDAASASVSVVAGDNISAADVQFRMGFMQLGTGVGSSTITLGSAALPAPICAGDELNIYIPPGYNSASLPASSNNQAMTLPGNASTSKLINRGGKWQKIFSASA